MTQLMEARLQNICTIIKEQVSTEQIYLFGSYAYGTPTSDSDLDLYVVLPDEGAMKPAEAVKQIRRALCHVDIPLDILASPLHVFNQRQQGASLERSVARKGVLVYSKIQTS